MTQLPAPVKAFTVSIIAAVITYFITLNHYSVIASEQDTVNLSTLVAMIFAAVVFTVVMAGVMLFMVLRKKAALSSKMPKVAAIIIITAAILTSLTVFFIG